ncbi:hypothetical protein evm_006946 [Chilo suppressalis]|nr:hypothetical protein evm_006946 [Chilo suppressalis]
MRDCRVVFLVQYSGALSSYKCRDCCRLYVVLQNRSVSVIMRDCRVVFLVQYSGARLEIADRANHCDGQLAHVQAARVFAGNKLERGSLRVNGAETLGSAEPPVVSAAALPELGGARYWAGGRPPGAPALAPPLRGCLGGLTVDRHLYSLLDTPARHGLEPSCEPRMVRSAAFEGSGFIELSSPALKRKSSIGISFRARGPGLLLYRTPDTADAANTEHENHYLALMIIEGDLQLIAAAGKAELRLRTNGTKFDDDHLHAVRIIRVHKQLELWVDDALETHGTLAGGAIPARPHGLFLGGVNDTKGGYNASFPTTGFTGTIADVIVDAQLVGLETARSWHGAREGRGAGAARGAGGAPRPLHAAPDDAAPCTKSASYTVEAGAVKFGDAPWSHAALRLPAKGRGLVFSLEFRTFQPDGLLVLAPGSKAKPKHYLALMIREGKLKLVVRGRKRRELSLVAFVADGTWRSVSVSVSRTRVALWSGSQSARAATVGPARARRLYVGGLPAPAAPRALPPAIVRVGGFVGCVRKVTLNNRAEDLVRDARDHHAVGQCFPDVEQAAYFAEGTADLPDGGRENFKGCIAEVWVGGRLRPWSEMNTHHVLLDSCPKR